MSFYDIYKNYAKLDIKDFFSRIGEEQILRIIGKERLSAEEFLVLLSPVARKYLEHMARKANEITQGHFGKVIFLYAPMYLANYCVNRCVYCGFNIDHGIARKKLTMKEVEEESRSISAQGIRHILLLTGESRKYSPVSYLKECIEVMRNYFTSISLEVYPLETWEYAELIIAGADGLTIYQEVYDEKIYDEVHLAGPKKNYRYRLDAPERACQAGMRTVNIGALLGLEDWRQEAFFTGLHADYLQNKYLNTEISLSLPRLRPEIGGFQPKHDVDDASLVQIMLAFRLFLPRAGITISTRERAELRDNLIGLGVTRMSAGSSTEVGGYASKDKTEGQFEVSDDRTIKEITKLIYQKGYQPVFKDWQCI
ncbi:MAG: thiamine biosynthesis protein ThiH [Gracilibacter sp. BRH_c7a]|nr:MAG: thiamine biosynthesis protein ThiH [Gracilibacter sp. BRH_c7a]